MKNSITKFATLFTLLLVNLFYAQNIITVDNNVNSAANFTTLQAAINAAADNDFIYISPSATTYGDAVCIKKLHFRGIAHTPELTNGVAATIGTLTFGLNSSASSVSGLVLFSIILNDVAHNLVIENNKINQIAVSQNSDNWIIRGNVISQQIVSSTLSDNWQILNNYITNANGNFLLSNLRADTLVSNNILVCVQGPTVFNNCLNIARNNLFLSQNDAHTSFNISNNNSNVVFANNLTFNFTGTIMVHLPGTNNYNNTNPTFDGVVAVNTYSHINDYNITNPNLIGTDGTKIGIFGLNFPFSKRGYPFSMPYIESMSILNPTAAVGGTVQVNVTAKSN